ncbi:MAG: LLM class flavin-dependent oxidoreductase, partial [Candidatus Binatia bacterium]|nr:LLM class flavin-dependent oxidoreductase [Candidatus Binatia bacterium]
VAYGAQYGRTINSREAGVLILTHVSQHRARAQEIAQRFFQGFPLPPESLSARCAVGTPEECIEKIRSYIEVGCSKFVLWPVVPPDELVSQIETYGRAIIPHFS